MAYTYNNETVIMLYVDDVIAAVTIFPTAVAGLIVYVMYIVVVYATKEHRENSYHLLAAALGQLDCITLVGKIFYCTPSVLARYPLGGHWVNAAVGSSLIFGWYGGLPIICALAFNRFYCVCKKDKYKQAFSIRRTKATICGSLVFGVGYGTLPWLDCCNFLFYPTDYGWGWSTHKLGGYVINYLELSITCLVVAIATTCNAIVFMRYRKLHNVISSGDADARAEAVRREREFKLFVQFFVIILWMTIFDATFVIAPFITSSKWLYLAITFMYIIQCSINGWVYVLMNRNIRRRIVELCSKEKDRAAAKGATSVMLTRVRPVSVQPAPQCESR